MRPLVASIDLAALKLNLSFARRAAPNSKVFAVIKADAYGHGAIQCARALDNADGFAVASIEEAIELRDSQIESPILVLSAFSQTTEVQLLHKYQLMPVIHSQYQLDLLDRQYKGDHPINCWLKIDTGMNRLGLSANELAVAFKFLKNCKTIKIAGVMSHLACSDETDNQFTNHQLDKFCQFTEKLNLPRSLANSAAIMAWPQTHKDWNRPGIMLYGVSPLHSKSAESDLNPVMDLSSRIIAIKMLKKNHAIGYGRTFTADKDMTIGIVACGYADGYPRDALTGTPILVCGKRTRTIGRVSMDSMAVDLTDLNDARIGSKVMLWGKNISINEIASSAGTIAYELLTRVSKRVPRNYINQ